MMINITISHLSILQQLLRQETLTQDKVRVRQVSQRLQQDLNHNLHVSECRVELVKFQKSQIGLKIVALLSNLELNVMLQGLDVLRIVPLDALQHHLDLGPHSLHGCLAMVKCISDLEKLKSQFEAARHGVVVSSAYKLQAC